MKKAKVNFYDIFGINYIPPFLKDGIVISVILHIFFLILIMVSPYIRVHSFIPRVKYDEPIIVDLENVIIGKETILPPAPPVKQKEEVKKEEYVKPEVKKEELPPPPLPKETKPEFKTDSSTSFVEEKKEIKEAPKPKDISKERMGGLDDLLASVDGLKHKDKKQPSAKKEDEKTIPVKKGIEAVDLGSKNYQQNSAQDFLKKQMAISYIDAIRIKLRSCWNLDPGAKDIKNMKIVIRTSISPDGNINNIEILNKDEYLSSSWFKAVAESAKRALIICSPYSLPIEFYQDWKDIVFTFYPDKKSVQ
ncbi:MAG: cell envelope integrity protein TolA [Alphaproteobacteria bacterium]|nr:cell envelope integrity protein TolA [Alphaproteobacteria bacterium]